MARIIHLCGRHPCSQQLQNIASHLWSRLTKSCKTWSPLHGMRQQKFQVSPSQIISQRDTIVLNPVSRVWSPSSVVLTWSSSIPSDSLSVVLTSSPSVPSDSQNFALTASPPSSSRDHPVHGGNRRALHGDLCVRHTVARIHHETRTMTRWALSPPALLVSICSVSPEAAGAPVVTDTIWKATVTRVHRVLCGDARAR